MSKWRCTVCGYIYDPDDGDPENDIDPGTAFEDLPPDWICPECGAEQDQFEEIDEEEEPDVRDDPFTTDDDDDEQ